ncbi:hypothetical protein Pcinc_034769 [Petrolisthes cinctipes]|uniref:Uncharacterized protein n=1 Tax=Petrolisthes cinctipes TaxID=88211 RepID=A0AAE1EQ01_PETCI|nr:hypothetical protein Pcinc_034769 [Petrolisthes cinctipes]
MAQNGQGSETHDYSPHVRALNIHLHSDNRLTKAQREVAKVAEMIHTASLVHDDVLDASDKRRGKPSVNCLYGQRKMGACISKS